MTDIKVGDRVRLRWNMYRTYTVVALDTTDLLALIRAARQEVIDAVLAEHPVEEYQSPLGGESSYYCVECYIGTDWMSTDPLDRCATVRALRPWIKEEA